MDPHERSILKVNEKPEQKSLQSVIGDNEMSFSILKNLMSKAGSSYGIDCECGPDLYNRFLGPTADEAVLSGMQIFFSALDKYTNCHKERRSEVHFQPASAKSVPKLVSEILESIGLPPEMVERIVQTSFASLKEERPELASKILQTSAPEMVSRILQTIGFEPEVANQLVQTSFISVSSAKPSLRSGMMQTTPAPSLISVSVQTSRKSLREELTTVEQLVDPKEESKLKIDEQSIEQLKEPSREQSKEMSKQQLVQVNEISKEKSEEVIEKTKKCVCCQCNYSHSEKRSDQRIPYDIDFVNLKSKFEMPSYFKISKCCECSAPVIYQKTRNVCFTDSKSQRKCLCRLGKQSRESGTILACSRRGTYNVGDGKCTCESHKICYY